MLLDPPRAAALVARRGDQGVLIGVRTTQARSWPGTLAFPGGAVDDADARVPLLTRPGAHLAPGGHDLQGRARVGALRESLEEAGLVRFARPDGAPSSGADVDTVLAALRANAPLHDALALRGLVLDDRGLLLANTWLTAENSFLVDQFLLDLDRPWIVPPLVAELAELDFRDPRGVLEAWHAGRAFLLPPIRRTLAVLARHTADAAVALPLSDVARALGEPVSEQERHRRDLVAGVAVFQGRTPTLPPATRTNTSILGDLELFLVDPATPFADEQRRFDAHLAALLADGGRVRGIVLTHHHHDHVGDAERLRARHGCPIYAHREAAARLPFAVDALLDEGDTLHVPGPPERRFTVLVTPGHAPGHICLWEPILRLLVAGDMVAGEGSILIDPPEGHMNTYLAQLERLAALEPHGLIPAHGPLLTDGAARLRGQVAHRRKRADAVVAALAAGHSTVEALVAAVYGQDTPQAMWPLAARSLVAILEALVEDGRAAADPSGYHHLLVT